MCGLFQPIGQVRLTNVATVRLKVGGCRFEIACYKNKVLNWRSGVETDIQEVLQSPYIFTSISKGKLAKNDQLMKAFGTKEIDVICKQILDKGEIQVSKEERNQQLQATFKDIVTILSEVAINPKTGHPLTSTLIENTLKSSAFSVNLREPAKKQALKALAHLQQLYPNEIARSQMRLKITCTVGQRYEVLDFLRGNNAYIENDGAPGGKRNSNARSRSSSVDSDHSEATTPVESQSSVAGTQNKAHSSKEGRSAVRDKDGSSSGETRVHGAVVNIRFLCCTKIYREIDNFVSNMLQPPGSLQLVALNVKDAGNIGLSPVPNVSTQAASETNKSSHSAQDNAVKTTQEGVADALKSLSLDSREGKSTASTCDSAATKKPAFKCTNCKMHFDNAKDYRAHFKSELHVFNNKLTLKGLAPVSPQEFEELELCSRHSSLT
ncbi:Ribosome maturation SBDS [Babesia ovata]|uniref:Ribosome maturation SBDS n=1 Tax=Babesia ovata TaxID=189622 RepID=A0A2H6K9M1_9APIC|nr:Ribosome maturation SBDS [Babesia ovata]GBE59678.1 Ribosome maturation SBDS [Babesia ovata]